MKGDEGGGNDHEGGHGQHQGRQHREEHDGGQEDGQHHGGGGHDGQSDHAHHAPEMFRDRLLAVLLLNIPVLAYSQDIQRWFGFSAPVFPGSEYVTFVFGTAIFVYGGAVFVHGAVAELQGRKPGMMTLISLAITVAYVYSAAVTFGFPGHAIYWELSTLVAVMLLGHWAEMRSVQGAKGALEELTELLPATANRETDGKVEEVPLSELSKGDVILLRPGDRVPSDSIVIEGESYLDESMLTGESVPVFKRDGDEVIGGTINQDGSLRVRVERTEEDTALAGIMRLVREAQESSSPSQALADRAAFWLVIIALTAAALTAIAWTALGESGVFIIERVVTVLVMTCPHALGLAIPLVIAISITLSAKGGLLVRDRRAMEDARSIDCVVFDKTGTLTEGEQRLTRIDAMRMDEDEILRLAAAAEADSEHMIARGIGEAAAARGLEVSRAESFRSLPGRGVEATVDGHKVQVGGPNMLEMLGIDPPEGVGGPDMSALHVVVDGELEGSLSMADAVRPESEEAVERLRADGVRVVMLTGDSEAVARRVSEELNIDQHFAEVLPEDKASKVRQLRGEGYKVAMVGDGVNDAPALAAADLGIAIGAGTDVAVESAGIVLLRNDPRDVARLMSLSKATYSKMLQNLAWATGYNVVAIPLAAGILAGIGFIMPMAVGAVLMSTSTVIVAANAQLLRRLDLDSA